MHDNIGLSTKFFFKILKDGYCTLNQTSMTRGSKI